jgi:hypothetical protein
MHETGKSAISPGLSLQEERLFSLPFHSTMLTLEETGGTNRHVDRGEFYYFRYGLSRSQWPRGLRREPSSPTRTLGS